MAEIRSVVSQVLSQSLELKETLTAVLELLHERGSLHNGMVCLQEQESRDLLV